MGNIQVNLLRGINSFIRTRASVPINPEGLKFTPELMRDTCHFRTDRTLCPKYLRQLLEIKGSESEKLLQIKNRMLTTMGYERPELVSIVKDNKITHTYAFDYCSGRIYINEQKAQLINMEEKIALLRHELDHFDRGAQIVKSKGVDELESALRKYFKSNIHVDKNFWEQAKINANTDSFDAEKYLRLWKNPPAINPHIDYRTNFGQAKFMQLQCMGELEASAYSKERAVLKAFGVNSTVAPDVYITQFNRILDLMKKQKLSETESVNIFNNLYNISRLMKHPDRKILITDFKAFQEKRISPENLKRLSDALGNDYIKTAEESKHYSQIESWIENGIFTIDDVLKTL